jgi:hypothetical protein
LGCPPLTTNDILTLRGQPMSKRNESLRNPIEEWIYYNPRRNNKESYVFKKEKLIRYKTNVAI